MGKAIVATHCVSDISALTEQLTNLPFGEPVYYLLQRTNNITDWKKGVPDPAEIQNYTHGRLFGKNGEIRWQKAKNGYSLLWLSEGDLPEGFESFGKWQMTESNDVLLLGGGETKPWRDTRIPRTLNYPMQWCETPQVRVVQYRDLHSQAIRFTRYAEFVDK